MAGPNRIADLHAALTWDLSDFQRGTRSIEAGLNSIVNLAGRMADAVASAGRKMTLGLSLPLGGIATFVTKAARDAEELQSAFDTTFSAMSAGMNKWAEESGDRMGRATQEMQVGALAFGQLFNNAAPNEQAAARLSQRFTELAQDAASFYNTDFDTAMGKIRSGLTGEAEPLRDFGVFLTEAAVKAKALEMGLISAGQELNEQGKIMARAELITEGLMSAYGDIARTSDSLANRLRALAGMARELAIEFGRYLVPYAKAAAAAIANVLQWVQNLPEGVKRGAVAFGVFLAALGPLTMALSTLAIVTMPLLLLRFASLATLGGRLLFAMSAILNPIYTLIVAGGKLAGSFGVVSSLLGRLLPLFLRLAGPVGAVITLFQIFGDDIVRGLRRFFDAVSKAVGPQVQQFFAELADLSDSLTEAFERLQSIKLPEWLVELGDKIAELQGFYLDFVGTLVGTVFSGIVQFATGVIAIMGDMVDSVNSILKNGWEAGWEGAVQAVGRAIIRIGQWIHGIWPALGGLVMLLGKLTGAKIEVSDKPPAIGRGGDDAPSRSGGGGLGISGGSYALDEEEKKRRGAGRGRGRTGPSAEELADRRAALELEHEIAVARERGDSDALRALERKRDLRRTIEQYERAGLSAAQAKTAAEKDMLELDEARAEARAKELTASQRSFDVQLARLREDHAHLRTLEDEEFLKRKIDELERIGLSTAEAEEEARKNLLALEEARADAVERRAAAQRAAHAIELAELRGDRALADTLRDADRVRARTRELMTADGGGMNEADAYERALTEASERSRAAMQGNFRDAFRGGLYAAMNGNFWDWFKQRLNDSAFDALAKVLDRLADNLADLVSGKGGGGGIFGAIGQALGIVGAVTGGAGGMHSPGHAASGASNAMGKPGFASGGSFRIKGFPGIDRNILSLNGSPVARVSQSEIIDVRRGEPAGRATNVGVDVRLHGFNEMFDMSVDKRIGNAAPSIASAGAAGGFAKMQEYQNGRLD